MNNKRIANLAKARAGEVRGLLDNLFPIIDRDYGGWFAGHYLVYNSDIAAIEEGLGWFKENKLEYLLKTKTRQYRNACESGSTILDVAMLYKNYKKKVSLILPFCGELNNTLSKKNLHLQAFVRPRSSWDINEVNVANSYLPKELNEIYGIGPYVTAICNHGTTALDEIIQRANDQELEQLGNKIIKDYQKNIFNISLVSSRYYLKDILKYGKYANNKVKVDFFNFLFYDNQAICYNLDSGIDFVKNILETEEIFNFIGSFNFTDFKKLKISEFKNLFSKIIPTKRFGMEESYDKFILKYDMIMENKYIEFSLASDGGGMASQPINKSKSHKI